MIAALAGLLAGAVHVLSGPDHLAAIAPLAGAGRRCGWHSGFRWGLGHAAGVTAVGVLALLLRESLPIDLLSTWSERLVGVVLIGIGLWGLRAALGRRVHAHEHEHDGVRHAHVHVHAADDAHVRDRNRKSREAGAAGIVADGHEHGHGAFAVGGLHGLAGSSHLLGVLPALALPSPASAVSYFGGFAMGGVLAMTLFSALLGWAAGRMQGRGNRAYRGLLAGCGISAILVGSVWLFR